MSGSSPGDESPEVPWPLALESFLQKAGDPAILEAAADAMERLATDSAFPEVRSEREEVARVLRELAMWARAYSEELEDAGMRYDLRRGCVVVPSGRRGASTKLLTIAIGQVLRGLDPEKWFSPSTYESVRRVLSSRNPLAVNLTDDQIRRAIERHDPKVSIQDWPRGPAKAD